MTDPVRQTIQFENGKIITPDHPTLPFIEGDGVGAEVMRSARLVADAAVQKAYGPARGLNWLEVFAGEKAQARSGNSLPTETLDAFREFRVGLKGPLNTPIGEGARSLNVALRKELDLYVNLRPVKYYPPAPSPLVHPERVDVVLFRENTEDVYAGIEFETGSPEALALLKHLKSKHPAQYARMRFPATPALGIKPISPEGSRRIVRAALEWALRNQRQSLTLLHKGNIMKFTEGGFMKWGYDLAETEFADRVYSLRAHKRQFTGKDATTATKALQKAREDGKLIVQDSIVDAAFETAIARPEEMDVLVTTNLNGDYLSDALAALVGGLGIAPGANINMESGDAVFEAVHGTAPDIAGRDRANPSSLILSTMLMLRYLGWTEAADLIEGALSKTLAAGFVTPDFYARMQGATLCSTSDFTRALIKRI